jgi:hypothetical protein
MFWAVSFREPEPVLWGMLKSWRGFVRYRRFV